MSHRSPLVLHRMGGPVAAIALMFATGASVQTQTPRAADERSIKEQLAEYAKARTQGDGRTQALFYTEDADEWGRLPQMSKGRAELARDLNRVPAPGTRFKLEVASLNFLATDIALVDALYFGGTPDSVDPIGHAFYLMVRRDGRWLIRSARITAWMTGR